MTKTRRVAFHTLGCKLNFSETSTIARSLDSSLYPRVDFNEEADIYIINTCSVTDAADKKCRQVIRKTARRSPDAFIVVVGCYAQLKPEEITSIQGVDLVLGVNERFNLGRYLERIDEAPGKEVITCETSEPVIFTSSYSAGDRTRSFLKIQDGCDYGCSYCTIPAARGRSRNQSIEQCISDARDIVEGGVREIVLTGVNVGDFGRTTGENLHSLLVALTGVDGLDRIRISSIEPNLLTDEIIELVAGDNSLVPHFHIPLQSGNNRILGLMRRRYRRETFSDRIEKILEFMPDASIGADVIVGFPGESDDDFTDTFNFLSGLPVSYLHAFSFSSRDNTPAALMNGQVSTSIKAERSKKLQRLSEKKKMEYYRRFTGKTCKVLWEPGSTEGILEGFTENYLRVTGKYDSSMTGKISSVKLLELDENGNFITSPA